MRPLVGLLLLVVAGSRADTTTVAPTTVAPSINAQPAKNCSLYCFITPERHERVNFTLYNNLSCTHFVYGIGHMTSYLQYKGPSSQDDATHSYPGNFYFLRKLRKGNPSAKLLLGVHLNERDSLISYPPSRQDLAKNLIIAARELLMDGLFLRTDRPFIDNSRFSHFFKDLSTANRSVPVVLGVPINLLQQSLTHVLEAAPFVDAVYLMSTPQLNKLVQVDPLLASTDTPPERTISYHVQTLAAKGVPKTKIVVGLTTGAVVYKNYIVDSVRGEADGSIVALQETCGSVGETALDRATASETTKARNKWITSNAPSEESIGRKVRWLTSAGYGGVGLQNLQHDDPKGDCGLSGGPFPALRIAADNMECRQESDYGKSCTRFCYINSKDPLEKLQPAACSHIVVEASLSALGVVQLSPMGEATARWIRGWHVARKPRLIISLGSRETSDIWRVALAMQLYRKNIINQLQELMTEWGASGVEVSWTLGALDFPSDPTNLEALLVEMRETWGKDKLIALAVTHQSTYHKKYIEMKKLNTTVDKIVLHSHRFHSTRQPFTGHHSPLFFSSEILPDVKNTVEGLVAEWVQEHSVSRSMVVVGITAEPLSMQLLGADRADDSPFNMNAVPSYSNPLFRSNDDQAKATDGKKICQLARANSSRVQFISDLAVPFLVNGGQFVAYENERSVQMKTTWMSLNHLGGVAFFDVQLDDPKGDCTSQPFPLLSTIANTQVCETCVQVDGFEPCDTTFTTSCSYRIPTHNEKRTMSSERIPLDSCTQIVIEQAGLKMYGDGGVIEFQDETQEKSMAKLASSFSPKMGGKRLIATVRCMMSYDNFKDMVNHKGPATVRNLLSFMTKYSLSGIELACDQHTNEATKEGFSALIAGLQEGLIQSTPPNKCPHSLSLRLPIDARNLTAGYDVAVLNTVKHVVLEPFNDPPRKNMTHVNSPLFAANGHTTDVDTTLKAWAAAGLEKSKIIIQIPAYATLQEITPNVTEIGAAASEGRIIDQAQVCSLLGNKPSKMMWDSIATYAITDKHEWMSMQNQATIAYKIFYAIREGLGGIGLLALNEDDWAGKCGSGQFPLLTAARARCLALH